MSRIGNMPIAIPEGVTVTAQGNAVTVKGKLGELSRVFQSGIDVRVEDGQVVVTRADDSRMQKSCHGLSRTLVRNMIEGVTTGYKKVLTIEGTGFKAALQGNRLSLSLGFASPKDYLIPDGIRITVDAAGLNVTVEGISKELVGQAAARIRNYYPAEPYKGKGIKYADEQIRRKQGKTVA
ncbi:MAG TPA: 50S ribosomal protein L6 [Kiritimatiellia bacterium]|nr:50S ribosomal protein L6 [Kiritimatiellia bacterium]HOR97502.1 50S ribosomal protein L6 [Kiritimatiellia bacterium]HPW75363.1 50S ribosomal protein L6 [Kiritimatiellia bacterium]